jgi:NADPH:quinone reductase-like Zn-dependent oxidoreductase
LQAGQTVLIHAAAGGVGSVAVQLARLAGAHVSATASAGNRDYVQSLGATDVIDYNREHFAARTSKFDVVLDLVGGDTQARSWSVLKPGGTLASTVSKPDPVLGNHVGATGKNFATRADEALLTTLAALHGSGQLGTHIDSVFPFPKASHALARSMSGHVRGKVLLDMGAYRSSGPEADRRRERK